MINMSLGRLVATAAVAAVVMSRGEAALLPRACEFASAAEAGDTCKSMADAWFITEAQFISYNPGANCAKLTAGQEYCVEWSGKLPLGTTTKGITNTTPPIMTTSTRSTTITTAPSGPSPTQDGIVQNCECLSTAPTHAQLTRSVSHHRQAIPSRRLGRHMWYHRLEIWASLP